MASFGYLYKKIRLLRERKYLCKEVGIAKGRRNIRNSPVL